MAEIPRTDRTKSYIMQIRNGKSIPNTGEVRLDRLQFTSEMCLQCNPLRDPVAVQRTSDGGPKSP